MERALLNPSDVCVGCIVWLPKYKASAQIPQAHEVIEKAAYNHPVVILSIGQRPGSTVVGDLIVSIAQLTTFHDTPLSTYLDAPRSSARYRPSIPIVTDPLSPPCTALSLDPAQPLWKQSYIRLSPVYTSIPLSSLRSYDFVPRSRASSPPIPTSSRRLDRASYQYLMHLLSLEPDIFLPSNTISATANARLGALAATNMPRTGRRVLRASLPHGDEVALLPGPLAPRNPTPIRPPSRLHLSAAPPSPPIHHLPPSRRPQFVPAHSHYGAASNSSLPHYVPYTDDTHSQRPGIKNTLVTVLTSFLSFLGLSVVLGAGYRLGRHLFGVA